MRSKKYILGTVHRDTAKLRVSLGEMIKAVYTRNCAQRQIAKLRSV